MGIFFIIPIAESLTGDSAETERVIRPSKAPLLPQGGEEIYFRRKFIEGWFQPHQIQVKRGY